MLNGGDLNICVHSAQLRREGRREREEREWKTEMKGGVGEGRGEREKYRVKVTNRVPNVLVNTIHHSDVTNRVPNVFVNTINHSDVTNRVGMTTCIGSNSNRTRSVTRREGRNSNMTTFCHSSGIVLE